MDVRTPTVAVLGASGLIGQAVASSLVRDGVRVVAVARRYAAGQAAIFAGAAIECPIVALEVGALSRLIAEHRVEIVVNCLGVLQDGERGRTDDVHVGFVTRLLDALKAQTKPVLLVHVSIPGQENDDRTPFSISKRKAERLIAASSVPFIILRPGFVVAPAAYGGSALIRALAALPVELPAREAGRTFAVTDVADMSRTVAFIAERWRGGERNWSAIWEVMGSQPKTVGGVVEGFRRRFGGSMVRVRLPSWFLDVTAKMGDLVAHLGWSPAVRTTALRELRRGVQGNPEGWIAATAIQPISIDVALLGLEATVQEKWFARLYFAKPLIIGSLSLFWIASGLIALTVSYDDAAAILTSRGFSSDVAEGITIGSSVVDIGIGVAVAFKKTCRMGLLAGIGASALYMFGAALLAPDLWIEPLGALVKTGPAIVLMLVALATLDER